MSLPEIARFTVELAQCAGRQIAAAALDLCWVACGQLDGYHETLSPWDIAAGRLIVQEAGGCVSNSSGASEAISPELNGREVVAAAPGLYPAMVELLQS